MKQVKLYIACSLDGYIARKNGSIDWLDAIENPNQDDYGYNDFLSRIDTIVMGRKTYEEILGFGVEWPYNDFQTYVVSSKDLKISTDNTTLISDFETEIEEMKKKTVEKDIWIVGGGKLISSALNLELIDMMTLSIIPIILGEGIPLFPDSPLETSFNLIDTVQFDSGIVNLSYIIKRS